MSNAKVHIPLSKSITNRCLLLQAYSGQSFLKKKDISQSDDSVLIQNILQAPLQNCQSFDLKNCGTALRFLTAYFAFTPYTQILTGSNRLCERPIKPLVDSLLELGAQIEYVKKKGYAPLSIHPPKKIKKSCTLDSSKSSQFLSALLLLGGFLPKGLTINITSKSIASQAYAQMTFSLIKMFGIDVKINPTKNKIHIPPSQNTHFYSYAEKDYSSLAYIYLWVLASDKTARVKVSSLFSLQPDFIATRLMPKWGITQTFKNNTLLISKENTTITPKEKTLNVRNMPDLFLTFIAAAIIKKTPLKIRHFEVLQYKESNRIQAAKEILRALHIDTLISKTKFHIIRFPKKYPSKIKIESKQDHRIIMSFVPLTLLGIKVQIKDLYHVKKSFPQYLEEFERFKTA